ncbi:MAG TPA: DUF2785 domain-containing protein [Candidatus Dormibacteraeota bacterium]|jgi:hypothetical protein|nr:DUF2785 domain-containing protein [Candidatus Dormibacteraeota bacterium]
MGKTGVTRAIVLLLVILGAVGAACGQGAHGREYWKAIQANHYNVPEGAKAIVLAKELSGYLKLSDSELRDDFAYSILAEWILHKDVFSKEELLAFEEEWRGNLKAGIGENGTDTIFVRSFSALCLSTIAERELKNPFLGEDRYRKLLEAALGYLREEKDLRGFDEKKGWIHATAHTADLLAALTQHPLFTKHDQAAVLRAVGGRLETATVIFSYGEQDRLANVMAAMAGRANFDLAGFREWLVEMNRSDRAVWKDSPPKLEGLQSFENDTYLLNAFVAHVSQEEKAGDAKKEVLRALAWR